MKREITHLKVKGLGEEPCIKWTACGLIGNPVHGASYDPSEVDCKHCRYTNEYKQRVQPS